MTDVPNKNVEALTSRTRTIKSFKEEDLHIELEPNREEGVIELLIKTTSDKSHLQVKITYHTAMQMAYSLIGMANPV